MAIRSQGVLPRRVDNERTLAEFRRTELTAERVAHVLLHHGVTLINVPVGVGKSHLLDDFLDYVRARPQFDLAVVLAELTASLKERRLMKNPGPEVRYLQPRPRELCGAFDAEWRVHESHGTSTYAKVHICGPCPRRKSCFWPTQYGASLKGARFIFGTHQHVLLNPRFLIHLRTMTGAKNTLLCLDEAGLLAKPFRRSFGPRELAEFVRAVDRAELPAAVRQEWIRLTSLLTQASSEDLQVPGWAFPYPAPRYALAIQEAGLAMNPEFRWLGYDLYSFSKARPDRRWRDRKDNVVFIAMPYLAEKTIILTAGMRPEYVQRQLGVDHVATPFSNVVCQHRDTRFYNISSLLGAATHFRRNSPQILDFFALLIVRNIDANKLTLLVARKRFKHVCADYLTQRLRQWGYEVTIHLSNGDPPEQKAPSVIPFVNYGINGVNVFEEYHAAYCLTSYLIDEHVLRESLADVESDDLRFPVEIRLVGQPRKRQAGTFHERFRASDADQIARAYYFQHETSVVIQAVGRVRYATKPREVITFQPTTMLGVEISREFASLREARDFLGLPSGSEHDRRRQEDLASELRAAGKTTAQISQELSVSERTVRNRLQSWRERSGP